MTDNDLPEDLGYPARTRSTMFRDPMFWVATVLLLIAVSMVAVGISNGAMR